MPKENMKTVICLAVIGTLLTGLEELYFRAVAQSQARQRQMILDLAEFNHFEHHLVNLGSTNQ